MALTLGITTDDAQGNEVVNELRLVPGPGNRRRHVRCTVYEPCIARVDSGEYVGAVVNMSVGGAAIQLEVQLEIQPPAGTPLLLYIERIGRLRTKIVRPINDGVAVEFGIDHRKDRDLVAGLARVLSDYPVDES